MAARLPLKGVEAWWKCGKALVKKTTGLLEPEVTGGPPKSPAEAAELLGIRTALEALVGRMEAVKKASEAAAAAGGGAEVECWCGKGVGSLAYHGHVEGKHFRSSLKQVPVPSSLMLEVEAQGMELRAALEAQNADRFVRIVTSVLEAGTGAGSTAVGSAADVVRVSGTWAGRAGGAEPTHRLDGALRALAAVVKCQDGFACVAEVQADTGEAGGPVHPQHSQTRLGRVLRESCGVKPEHVKGMWHAVGFAVVVVASGGCRVLVRSSFAINASEKGRFSHFLGDVEHCDKNAEARYRPALRLLRDQAPPWPQPQLGDAGALPAAAPPAQRPRVGPGAGSPWFLDGQFAVGDVPAAAAAVPFPPFPLSDGEDFEVRRLGILAELHLDGTLACSRAPLSSVRAEMVAQLEAGLDHARAALRAGVTMKQKMPSGDVEDVAVTATRRELEEAASNSATALRGLASRGYHTDSGIEWYTTLAGLRKNVDGRVTRRADGKTFGLDLHRLGYQHADIRTTRQFRDKRDLCEERLADLRALEAHDRAEEQRANQLGHVRPARRCPVSLRGLSGFVVAHVCANDLVLDILER